jgi:hypothetical protein
MKKIVFIIICICATLNTAAAEKSMYVYLKNGDVVTFSISDLPKITFDDGVMTVGTELFQVSNVSKYTIGTETDDVISIDAGDLKVDARRALDGYVTISNLGKQEIKLFDLSGKEIQFKMKNENENDVVIDFNDHSAGTYILNIGTESIKLLKK